MRIPIFLILFLGFTARTHCQVTVGPKALVIDSLLRSCHDEDLFNGVALVADGGKVILHSAYGYSDLDDRTPLKLSDRFYIGSLTKQFTSVLILQLQEDGSIDIEAPIMNYLQMFSDSTYSDITVHQLLTHTSGLGNFTSDPDFDRSVDYSEQEMFDLIKQPLLFPPGSDWSYSNSGYYLLGKIAERVSHTDYGTLLNESILRPLEMYNTAFSAHWLNEHVAKGYTRTIAGIRPMPSYAPASLFSGGGMYSTAQDLFVWTQALDGNALLTQRSKEILLRPVLNDYACGMYVKKGVDNNGDPFERHFHGGILQGYHSFILKRVPQKQVIILLDNFHSQEIQTVKNRIWSALIEENIRKVKPELSNLLYDACAENTLPQWMDSVSNNLELFEDEYTFDEFDINTVAYRLMEAERYAEAHILFSFNIDRFPGSWNVYDSMGELQLKEGNYEDAEILYKKSLVLNPLNNSAVNALKDIERHTTDPVQH